MKGTDKQIGLLQKWCLTEKTSLVGINKHEINQHKILGWTATAKAYMLSDLPPGELEFRFASKYNWLKCLGNFNTPLVLGEQVKQQVTMGGNSSPRIQWRD